MKPTKRVSTRPSKSSAPIDLSAATDRELLLFVHQSLSDQIGGLSQQVSGVLVEVEGVRDAVVRLEANAGKVDALITDMRRIAVRTSELEANVKIAHSRVTELEAYRNGKATATKRGGSGR